MDGGVCIPLKHTQRCCERGVKGLSTESPWALQALSREVLQGDLFRVCSLFITEKGSGNPGAARSRTDPFGTKVLLSLTGT